MFLNQKLKFWNMLALVIVALVAHSNGLCLGVTSGPICLYNIDDELTQEILKYVLGKYEEAEMPIAGEPIAVRGKRISQGSNEELHIVFQYLDNTPNDVIQNCGIVLTRRLGECETIRTYCSTFLPRTPRPLLRRKTLVVCDDGQQPAQLQVVDEEGQEDNTETVTITMAEDVTTDVGVQQLETVAARPI